MTRLYLLILLLTVVYSWEEMKYVWVVIFRKLRNKNPNYQKNSELDALVMDIVLIATIPISLAYLILSEGSLPHKLIIVLSEILLLSLAIKGIETYKFRRRFTKDYTGSDKIVAIIFSLAGLVSPSWKLAVKTVSSTANLSKYLFALALPLISGLVLAVTIRKFGLEEMQSKLDQLIIIAVLALMLNITIEILETIFKSKNLRISVLMRVALGILIIAVLR